MEKIVSKAGFKPKALEYFRLVEETGIELVITDRGRPVAKITPYIPQETAAAKALSPAMSPMLKETALKRSPTSTPPAATTPERSAVTEERLEDVAERAGGPESPQGVRQLGHAGMRRLG